MNSNKLFILMFLVVLLVGSVSASILTTHDYSEEDMKVEFQTLWAFDKGNIELKSHSYTREILEFGFGKEEVVMAYLFDWDSLEKEGLGEVIITDMRTGDVMDQDYTFVRWENVSYQKPVYREECTFNKANYSQTCNNIIMGYTKELREEWVDYPSRDIPEGKSRIGLKTYVGKNDYKDAVWTIAGDKVERHSEWTAEINVGLISYYKLEDNLANTAVNDSINSNEGIANTNTANLHDASGKINSAFNFDGSEYVGLGTTANIFGANPNEWSYNLWFKTTTTSDTHIISPFDTAGPTNAHTGLIRIDTNADILVNIRDTSTEKSLTAMGTYNDNVWHMVTMTVSKTANEVKLYVDGSLEDTDVLPSDSADYTTTRILNLARYDNGGFLTGLIDEVGLWGRALTPTEINITLYNNNNGNTWTDQFGAAPIVTLNAPEDTFNSTSETIVFNTTVTDAVNLTNVTLYIDGVLNETNSSGFNGTYIFTKALSEGEHNWSILAWNNQSLSTQSATRTFNITFIDPIVVQNSPVDTFNATSGSITFNCTATPNSSSIVNVSVIINGSIEQTNTSGVSGDYIFNVNGLQESDYVWSCETWDSHGKTNNSGNRTFSMEILGPTVTLDSPADDFNSSIQEITFITTVTDDLQVDNVTLYIDGIVNETNSSGFNGTYTFTKTILDGSHNWSILAYDNSSLSTQSATRDFTVDTTPFIEFINPTPVNGSNWSSSYIPISVNVEKNNCYQESATVVDQTGIDGGCGLDYSGNYSTGNGPYIYINYSKPSSTIGAKWLSKHGTLSAYNSTIPDSCISYDNNFLILRFFTSGGTSSVGSYGQCYNGTWNTVTNSQGLTGGTFGAVGEINRSYDGNWETYIVWFSTASSWRRAISGNADSNRIFEEAIYWQFETFNSSLFQNITYTLVNSSGTTFTQFFENETYDINFTDVLTSTYNYNATVCLTTGKCNSTETRFINVTIPGPNITLVSPENEFNSTVQTITFNVIVTDVNGVENVTLLIDGVINESNSSGINGSYTFSKTIVDGSHNWSILAENINSLFTQSETRNFTIDTTPFIEFIDPTPENNSNWTLSYIPMSVSVLQSCYQESANVSNQTGIDGDCSLNYSGVYSFISNYFYMNYTKPQSTVGAIWTIKQSIDPVQNTTIPDECFNTFGDIVSLRIRSDSVIGAHGDCFNSTDWIKINQGTNVGGSGESINSPNTVKGNDGNWSSYIAYSNSGGNWRDIVSGALEEARIFEEAIYWQFESFNNSLFQNITYTLANVNGTTLTQFFETETYDINFTNIQEDGYNYNATVCLTTGSCNTTETRFINVDAIAPRINITSPEALVDFGFIGRNETLNVTFNDFNLNSCWYNYNGTNITIDGCLNGISNSTQFVLEEGNYNITVYANDTLGNENSTFMEWSYKVFLNSHTYNNITIEGSAEDFTMNITLDLSIDLSAATMVYNGTDNIATILSSGQNRLLQIIDFTIPTFDNNTNVTFYWVFNISDSSQIISDNYTQEVNIVLLDNCSINTFNIFNLSLFDEEAKTPLSGTIEVFYEVLNKPDYNPIFNLSTKVESVSSTLICTNINLSGADFAYSTEIRYYADDYATELYHIQKADIISEVVSVELFDLLLNDSTEFLIKYQNEDLVKVEGAIIQLQRKYISENIFEVVEAPLTGNEGTAVVHVDLDTNKYRATVVKDGIILDVFLNIVFDCENELSGQCEQKLYATLNSQNEVPLETINDFAYGLSELGNETVDILFSIPSGTPSDVNIQLAQTDQFGNKTICNKSVISSAGSIQCTFDRTIGQSYLTLTIIKEGLLLATKSFAIFDDTANDFLGNNLIIVFLFLLSIGGMAMTSPEWIMINGVVTLTLVGLLWLVRGISVVEGLGMLAYLIIAVVILIMKISKQEDQ